MIWRERRELDHGPDMILERGDIGSHKVIELRSFTVNEVRDP